MRIAVVCGRDIERAQDTDGGSVLIRNLARTLSEQGHAIDVFIPANSIGGTLRTEEEGRLSHRMPWISMIRFPVQESGLRLYEPKEVPGSYFLNRMAISERVGAYFDDKKLHAYDRIYVFHMAHAFSLFENDRCPAARTILFPMLLGAFYRIFETVPEAYLQAEARALDRVQHIATPSAAEREALMREYAVPGEKIFLMRRGYDSRIFEPLLRKAIPDDQMRIICANVIKPQKDQRFFLELARAGHALLPRMVFHLIGLGETNAQGNGRYARELKQAVLDEELDEHFVFHDIRPQSEMHQLMRTCDIAFYPSRTETFGKSALESVVTGLPTIVFDDVPAFGEFIEDGVTGMMIKRSVPAALDAIGLLRRDSALYQSLSARGIGIAPRFTWESVISDFLRDSERHIGKAESPVATVYASR